MGKDTCRVIVHPYTPAMIASLERWLTKRASEGWRLVNVRGWRFYFRKCRPYLTKYFAYSGFDTSKGISSDYWLSKERYACKNSELNKACLHIYEVDIRKINADFASYVNLRNRFYLKHYIYLMLLSFVFTLLSVYVTFFHSFLFLLILLCVLPLVYACMSIALLCLEFKQKPENK